MVQKFVIKFTYFLFKRNEGPTSEKLPHIFFFAFCEFLFDSMNFIGFLFDCVLKFFYLFLIIFLRGKIFLIIFD